MLAIRRYGSVYNSYRVISPSKSITNITQSDCNTHCDCEYQHLIHVSKPQFDSEQDVRYYIIILLACLFLFLNSLITFYYKLNIDL